LKLIKKVTYDLLCLIYLLKYSKALKYKWAWFNKRYRRQQKTFD